jgi:hypothetical protein
LKGASYEADNGHDDLAMCLVIFAYLTTQTAFEDLCSQSAKAKLIALKQKSLEENVLPHGFFVDGTEEEVDVMNF